MIEFSRFVHWSLLSVVELYLMLNIVVELYIMPNSGVEMYCSGISWHNDWYSRDYDKEHN